MNVLLESKVYGELGIINSSFFQLLCGSGGELSAIRGEKKFSRILIKRK